jgi:hypothetical protein
LRRKASHTGLLPVYCRFIAGLAGEIRMRRLAQIRFDANIQGNRFHRGEPL